jgi:phage shock protein E
MLNNPWVILGLLLALAALAVVMKARGRTSPEEARRLVNEGATLLDVRSATEFASGHLTGAKNIPVGELSEHLSQLPDKRAPIVVYCRSGGRSSRAKQILEGAGYAAVYDLGGMGRWE